MREIKCRWCGRIWVDDGDDWVHIEPVKRYYDEGRESRADFDFCCLGHAIQYLVDIDRQLVAKGVGYTESLRQHIERISKEQNDANSNTTT
jgi:hypothetical protein